MPATGGKSLGRRAQAAAGLVSVLQYDRKQPAACRAGSRCGTIISTNGADIYRRKIKQLLPVIKEQFGFLGGTASRAIPWMDDSFRKEFAEALSNYKPRLQQMLVQNPYG